MRGTALSPYSSDYTQAKPVLQMQPLENASIFAGKNRIFSGAFIYDILTPPFHCVTISKNRLSASFSADQTKKRVAV
jgi:hypothetical protein